MIYTLTLNPAIDMNITAPQMLKDTTTRTKEMLLCANGKGINVSRVLKHFGVESSALGFFGGFTGEHIVNECRAWGIKTHPIQTAENTRINVFLTTKDGEYKMVNEGPTVTEENKSAMLNLIECITDLDVLTINGSAARNISLDFYEKIIRIAQRKNAAVILDISSAELKDLLKYKPLLIKPNDEEIENIFGYKVFDVDSAKQALVMLKELGAQNILLTLGSKGSFFYNGREFYQCNTKPVKLRSSLCAGDGFLAAFLANWLNDRDNVEEALKVASATGADIAESFGIGELKNVDVYKSSISVTKI